MQLVPPSVGQFRTEADKYKNNCVPLNYYSGLVIAKKAKVCVTKLQVGPYANELGSLTSPDLQDTRSSPKEAASTSTIDKNNSFRAYFEALHMQYAPDYLISVFSHMHLPPCEDLTEHYYTADLVIKVIS